MLPLFRSPRIGRRVAETSSAPRADAPRDQVQPNAVDALVAVTYELLDAHADTSRLAADHADDLEWQQHLSYLRDLQRVGRAVLARTGSAADAAER